MNPIIHTRKRIFKSAFGNVCRFVLQKKMLLTGILLTNVLIASFSQKSSVLLSSYDSCHIQPPQQTAFAIKAAVTSPMLRVAYVIPSNRTPQPNGVANLQHAIKSGQKVFREQMEQNGFGPKTFFFETEADGVTPLIHVVKVAETDDYLRDDVWRRTIQAATKAGISLWTAGEVWVVIPEAHLMLPNGTVSGGIAAGTGGTANAPGLSMIGSNALPLFRPGMITDDTSYDGKVLNELGPYPMKQDVTFNWFEGSTFSSLASSWLGALWHETAHAFGLPHDFRNDNNFHGNLMGNGLRGTRGYLFPERYSQDYTRLEYASALILNVSHYFNRNKMATPGPTVYHANPASVIPQQGLVHISFEASDEDSLSFAYLTDKGDLIAEIPLQGIEADTVFAVPYFAQGDYNTYAIAVFDKQGNTTYAGVQFNVPAGNNQAPVPFIRIDPPVPGFNQPIVFNATLSYDVDHDQSSLMASWDVDNDGLYDIEPSTNKTVQYQYENPGNYLVRLKLTDPAGAQTISTAVSVKIPGEKKIAVESFTLMDADKDETVAELQDGLIIQQTAFEGRTFSVLANTSPGMIDRVEFNLIGPIAHEQIDNDPPYALFGDSPQGNFIGRELLLGDYSLTATPYFGSEKGNALTVAFKVKGKATGQASIEWDKTLGGIGMDMLRGVTSTSDGGFL
ncbi:MAG TPA: PKD domain-containing protein, partial [Chryseolinea sp.]